MQGTLYYNIFMLCIYVEVLLPILSTNLLLLFSPIVTNSNRSRVRIYDKRIISDLTVDCLYIIFSAYCITHNII